MAALIATALDATFAGGNPTFKTDNNLVYLIGHTVTDPGPLPYVATTPDPSYNSFARSQDNAYAGFYVDDVIVGFAERGEEAIGRHGRCDDLHVQHGRPRGRSRRVTTSCRSAGRATSARGPRATPR